MEIVLVTIVNWEKYNPKTGQRHTWFRHENTLLCDPRLHGLNLHQKYVFVALLEHASSTARTPFELPVSFMATRHGLRVSTVRTALDRLRARGLIQIHENIDTRPSKLGSQLPPTNVTNERNERTNGTDGAKRAERSQPIDPDRCRAAAGLESLSGIFQERKVIRTLQERWLEAFPDAPWIVETVRKALAWEAANSTRRKKEFGRFITNWLSRDWDRRKTAPMIADWVPPEERNAKPS